MMKAGSCAAGHRESGQVRKEAALSGLFPGAAGSPGWSQPPGLRRNHCIRRRVHGYQWARHGPIDSFEFSCNRNSKMAGRRGRQP